jgi:hypothetical protein
LNCKAKQRRTTISRKISQRPRVNKKRESSDFVFFPSARPAPVPVSRKNTGAQMLVIQRVKNNAAVACARLVGLIPGWPK